MYSIKGQSKSFSSNDGLTLLVSLLTSEISYVNSTDKSPNRYSVEDGTVVVPIDVPFLSRRQLIAKAMPSMRLVNNSLTIDAT